MSLQKHRYKYCIVPICTNTTITAPEIIFFDVPRNDIERNKWCLAMNRDAKKNCVFSVKSSQNVCQDHFDLEHDTENYLEHKFLGTKLRLKKGTVPHIFACQQAETLTPSTCTERAAERKQKNTLKDHLIKIDLSTSDSSSCNFEETDITRKPSASDPEIRRVLTALLSCFEKPPLPKNSGEMKLGEQTTGTHTENISLDAMSDSNGSISERKESGRKFPGRPRKIKRGPFRSMHKKEKDIFENSQANCGEITSSNGNASDANISSSISSKKRGPFRSIYNEKKDISTDSQMNCLEISSSSGNVTDQNVSSSFSSQFLPNVCIKKETPWEEEYNLLGNSPRCLSKDSNKMQIEINDVRSVASTGSLSDEKVNTNQGKAPGSLSGPLKIEPREEVFGKLVACEMSDLCTNPEIYLKTKQAILNLLVQARFDQMKQNGEVL